MLTLRNLERLSDPFMEACRRADSPGALLGKHPPEALRRVEKYIGTPLDAWTVQEWRRASEILGHLADALEEREREADEARQKAAAPKRRGPKPKHKRSPLTGLLSVRRGRGKPKKRSEQQERDLLDWFLESKDQLEQRSGDSLTDIAAVKAIGQKLLAQKGKRASRATPERVKAFAKDVSRWRRRYGVPRRNKKGSPKKSQ